MLGLLPPVVTQRLRVSYAQPCGQPLAISCRQQNKIQYNYQSNTDLFLVTRSLPFYLYSRVTEPLHELKPACLCVLSPKLCVSGGSSRAWEWKKRRHGGNSWNKMKSKERGWKT